MTVEQRPRTVVTLTIAGVELAFTRGFVGTAFLILLLALLPAGFLSLANWLGGLAFVLIYAGSVLLHELAHALAATRCGFTVTAVRLTWTGGETHYEGDAPDEGPPKMVAGSGLLASALAALVFVSIVIAQGASGQPGDWVGYATFAAEVNVLLTLANALPISGSDGSHLLSGRKRRNPTP